MIRTTTEAVCDRCGRQLVAIPAQSRAAFVLGLDIDGWHIDGDASVCPTCADPDGAPIDLFPTYAHN